ncbi:MAG: HAMP domain-containing histidine kinase [Sphingomonadaceae bacterium]|nr:HAMP domain-containing histidine kinase [Sphingomonadaceae bacterium]
MNRRALPILWQTLLLIVATLIVAQLVPTAFFMFGPQPRPDFVSMRDLADAIAPPIGRRGHPRDRERPRMLLSGVADMPPDPHALGMVANPEFTEALARLTGIAADRLRLVYESDQSQSFPYHRERDTGGVPMRHGDPLFFNTVLVGVEQPDGRWQLLRSPPRPWLSQWQKRFLLWFATSAILMLPVAFLFARRITRPMRRFATAVETLGHDPDAPPVPVEGPAELRLTAQALNTMQQRLQDYLAERTAMIGAIAHDLRTPLARIAFRIEGAPEAVRSPVQADIEQMRAMVAATIGYLRSGAGVGERAAIDLAPLVARVAAHAREMGGSVAPVTAQGRCVVTGDALALERLVQNLVDNAVKYGGGAELELACAEGLVRLQVIDRGPGIAPELIERLFRPFERGEPSRSRATGGLGLGLAIARAIAVAHGGTLQAMNRNGGGLEMVCMLPAV